MGAYQRSIKVINPRFQFKFSLFVCGLVFVSSLIYPITIYGIFESFFQLSPKLSEVLAEKRSMLLMWLTLFQIMYTAFIFVVCIFLTHKIAGPLYKLSTFFKEVANGDEIRELYFRNGDNFPEIAEQYNDAMKRIKEDRKNDFEYLSEVSSYIKNLSLVVPEDKKPVLNEITKRLQEIDSKYHL